MFRVVTGNFSGIQGVFKGLQERSMGFEDVPWSFIGRFTDFRGVFHGVSSETFKNFFSRGFSGVSVTSGVFQKVAGRFRRILAVFKRFQGRHSVALGILQWFP